MDKILEAKITIARFMGAEITEAYSKNADYKQDGYHFYYPKGSPDRLWRSHSATGILYDTSADWLIPVFIKLTGNRNKDFITDMYLLAIQNNLLAGDIEAACLFSASYIKHLENA